MEFDMSTMLYTVTSRDTIFNGENDFEERLLYKIFQKY